MVWYCVIVLCLCEPIVIICTMIVKSVFYKLLDQWILSTCKYWFSFCATGNKRLRNHSYLSLNPVFFTYRLYHLGHLVKVPWDLTGMTNVELLAQCPAHGEGLLACVVTYRSHSFFSLLPGHLNFKDPTMD